LLNAFVRMFYKKGCPYQNSLMLFCFLKCFIIFLLCVCVCVFFCTFAHAVPSVHNAFLWHLGLSSFSTPTSYSTFLWQPDQLSSHLWTWPPISLFFFFCKILFILLVIFGYLLMWLSSLTIVLFLRIDIIYIYMYLGCLA